MSYFKTAIRAATEGVIERLKTAHSNNEVYALVFYPTSGFGDIDVLYATKGWLSKQPVGKGPQPDEEMLELLKSHPDLLQQVKSHRTSKYYFEVNAYEWDSPISFFDLFTAVNEILHEMEENDSIESILTEVLQDLRSSGQFESDAFANDVLLGVQFSDPSPNEVDLVTRISLAVNSAETHAKICDGYGI